ncbi:MAG: hypothetical protein ACRD8A_19125 [Candidatus Acidiferrales bacterium]
MSQSLSSTVALLVFATVFMGSSRAASQVSNSQCREEMTYSHVRQTLLAAYPDLPASLCKLRITFSTPLDRRSQEFTSFDAAVTGPLYFNPMVVKGKHVSQVEWTTLLGAHFAFGASWRPQNVLVWGRWVHSDELSKVTRDLVSHPGWGNERAIDLLSRAGAKYTPDHKEAFISHIPLKTLRAVLGTNLTIKSVRFENWSGKDDASLFWSVDLQAGHQRIGATFEPFDGRLTTMMVLPQ